VKLHSVVGSPNCRKVQAVINHLDIEIEIEYHDFFAGELQSPGYLSINPNAMVPVLTDGALTLWESNAIMQYLADKHGGDELFPRDPQRRAEVVRWQMWELAHFNKAFGTLGFELVLKPAMKLGPPNQAVVEASLAALRRFAPVLDGHLESRRYLVGSGVTIADYSVIHLEGFKGAVGFDWTPYRHLNDYFDRMRKDEHWAETAPANPADIGRKPKAA
jgi:glutathione S-transferase